MAPILTSLSSIAKQFGITGGGGGGGGARSVGSPVPAGQPIGGPGGIGMTFTISGSPNTYAGGGGGGSNDTGGNGGNGGGGNGGTPGAPGTPGSTNTGGGGGGGRSPTNGGNGGPGIVIVRYLS